MNPAPHLNDFFLRGDFDGAQEWLQGQPALQHPDAYKAHPLLRAAVENNGGHCYKRPQLMIADLFLVKVVQRFRAAVVENRVQDVARMLQSKPALIHAEFTAGRGIAQAIHHWYSPEMGQLLINAGADIHASTTVGGGGETALVAQLRFGSLGGTRLLLESGADPNAGQIKFMPTKKMAERVAALLEYGWNINEGAGERTLMHHDAAHGHGTKIRILLEAGADPNVRDVAGRTALHLVAQTGKGADTVRALIAAGADIEVRDNEGLTALDLARAADDSSAAEALLE